jgi:energy-coupling factor transport system ATP-binding protein
LDEAEVRRRVDWALGATGLGALRERKPAELSGGQKQCLAIAAVLAMRPQVLVLDEPTASLDVDSSLRLMATLRALRDEQGLTLVLIEHRLAEAARLADRLVLMDGGCIVAQGAPLELLADRALRTRMGLRRPAEETPARWRDLIEADDGQIEGDGDRWCDAAQTPLLALKGISAGYRRQVVLHDVDLAVYPGDFLALVGDNGAGKSTLALVAAGLLKPMSGTVHYAAGRRPRAGLDVALLFQDPTEQLFTDSVDDEVAFGPQNYGCFSTDRHSQTLQEAGLADLRERRPLSLSSGQQQRTALAACLALRPSLVILDEPALGQDWGHLTRLMDFVCDLNRRGAAIVLISHDYKLVHHYARRAVLMDEGRIQAKGNLPASQQGSRSTRGSGGAYEANHT